MSRKLILLPLLIALIIQVVFGQVTEGEARLRKQNTESSEGWKKGGVMAVTLTQTSLTNWAAGGQNSLSINELLSVFANYKKGKNIWDNSLDIGYGVLKQGKNSDFIKTDDKFDFLSKYGRQAYQNLYYAALLNFKTQLTIGKDYATDTKISNFLAPAYLLAALGMDYKPNSYFSAFAAPFTGKITIVNDQQLADAGAFGVDPGEKSKSEFGGYVRVIYTRSDFTPEILQNLALTSKIDLFSNYLSEPQNIDVSWETQIVFKVNQYVSVNLNTHLLYDDDIMIGIDNNADGVIDESGPRTQFKEILGIGFSYNF